MTQEQTSGAIEDFYRVHSAHSGMTQAREAIKALPLARTVLGWVGSGHRVVDLGCHKGDLSNVVRQAGNTVVGVDFPSIAKVAHEVYDIPVVGHDLNKPLPFKTKEFDTVLAISVMDYLHNDLDFLRECFRILEPGGRLIIVVPNAVGLGRRIKALFGDSSRDFSHPQGVHPYNHYTLKGIKRLIALAGFHVNGQAKCPVARSASPLMHWAERLLPATLVKNLAILAIKPESSA